MTPARRTPEFVEWREEFVSQERGSRVVHYYLADAAGSSHLAVVGTERSLRHMLYVVSTDFARAFLGPHSDALKWRSRREVIHWLASFLAPPNKTAESSPIDLSYSLGVDVAMDGVRDCGNYPEKHEDHDGRNLGHHSSDILWSGVPWTCSKQLKHYRAFCRNGISIAAHSFVLVMSTEESCYIAYIEDMYEDKKGLKKVKVRWCYQNQEIVCTIPRPPPHPREVFITPYSQVISAECINDITAVLTPEHYEKCVAALPCASERIYFCFRQYNKNRLRPFDLRSLGGYFDQAVLLCLDICIDSGDEDEEFVHESIKRRKPKRIVNGHKRILTNNLGSIISTRTSHTRACGPHNQTLRYELPSGRPLSVKFIGPRHCLIPPFKVNEKIELLCQDSGIRGCWFRCTVLEASEKRLKVRYDDLQDDEECGNLQEWVPAYKSAAPDKLGMRFPGRLTIRPCFPSDHLLDAVAYQIGSPVDAWWNDGWWEGVIIGEDSCIDGNVHVYFPGEDLVLICQRNNLRISKEWVENRWVDVSAKPDILSVISVVSPGTKLSAYSSFAKGTESGSSAMSDRKDINLEADLVQEEKKGLASFSSGTDGSLDVNQVNVMIQLRDENAEEDDKVDDS